MPCYTTGMERVLQDRIAVVTGASRGIGKGIALELGAAGATVYVTGRTVNPGEHPLPGTVGETASEIDALGGHGIAVACDHRNDDDVQAVFERVADDHGHLDVLVNNVYNSLAFSQWLGQPFWEMPLEGWDETIDIGLRSHYVASHFGVPLMFAAGGGVVVNVSSSGAVQYAHTVTYGVGKAGLDKMTADMAYELTDRNVAVVSVWPGLVRTELTLSGTRATEDGRSVLDLPGEGTFDLADAETPHFSGRAVVALASDANVMARSGRAFTTDQLAADYDFTDIDGSRSRRADATEALMASPPEPTPNPARRATTTSRFGTSKRESHDASDFYDRFPAPKILSDTTIADAGEVKDSVIHGDSRDLSMIPDNSVALVVTSPPYFAGKEYEAEMGEGHIPASYVDYLAMLRDVFAECWRVLEAGRAHRGERGQPRTQAVPVARRRHHHHPPRRPRVPAAG